MDPALNNLQWMICHKIKPNQSMLPPISQTIQVKQDTLEKQGRIHKWSSPVGSHT